MGIQRAAILPLLALSLAATTLPAVAARQHKAAAVSGTGAAATPVIIDTDMGIDDWPAMLYLLHHRQTRVLGVTVTGAGEAHCQQGVQHALELVEISPQKGLPVACGDTEPMDGYFEFPPAWRKGADSLYDVALPASGRHSDRRQAVQLLIDLLQKSKHRVKLVILGNATNVAQALLAQPQIKKKIDRIYVMGGAVWAKGNIIVPGFTDHYKNRTSEWNVMIDPVASRIVLQSGVPLTLVPLDATNDVRVTADDVDAFKQAGQTPGGRFFTQVLQNNADFIKSGEYYFWDALTASLVTHPEYCTYQSLSMDVIVGYSDKTNGDPLPGFSARRRDGKPRRNLDPYYSGQTIISDKGRQVQVCIAAKAAQFKPDLIQTINRVAAP